MKSEEYEKEVLQFHKNNFKDKETVDRLFPLSHLKNKFYKLHCFPVISFSYSLQFYSTECKFSSTTVSSPRFLYFFFCLRPVNCIVQKIFFLQLPQLIFYQIILFQLDAIQQQIPIINIDYAYVAWWNQECCGGTSLKRLNG